MSTPRKTLADLIGSRICHDLISPIGAIGNGLELLSMSGGGAGPEMALINDSVTNANARIRFFSIAFGAASDGQILSRPDILSILSDVTRGARLRIGWQSPQSVTRVDAKLLFLLIQCCESALPYGGTIDVAQHDDGWRVSAKAAKIRDLDDQWKLIDDTADAPDVSPAQVHFALVGHAVQASARKLDLNRGEGTIRVTLSGRVRT